MSYIIAEHQSATHENGASHKKVIIFLSKIVIKSYKFFNILHMPLNCLLMQQ